ncbi:MAG TPA: GMC family oxidoreductase, partial [Polyangiaceae bacterium]|nr:GMC family oxidoreductase [Polyangiaceae bacterium]
MVTSFEQVEGRADLEDACDAVVVGTGAGGGAIAAELAEGGRDVVMLEEGGHYTARDFTLDAPEMLKKLYRNAGTAVIRGRPNIIFSEGRCVGGSTVVNGGICWRTPEKVLKRWVWEHGLDGMTPAKLDPIFAKVEERVHAAPQDPGSVGEDSELLRAGAERLGYRVVPVKRNQVHCCGTNNCVFGCPTDAKRSTLVAYVPRVLANRGRLYAKCRAERILVENGRAVGIVGRFRDPESGRFGPRLTVRAKVVILAAGAIQTPALLQRNKLANSSGQLGRNFLIHPNAKAIAIYDRDVLGWKGTIQGYQIHEFVDEGIVLTTSFVPPGLLALSFPYFGRESLEVMRDYNRMIAAGALVEDTHAGRVSLDWFGEAKMSYQLDAHDVHQLVRGIALLSEIYFESGARRVLLPFAGLEEIRSPDEIRKLFERPIPPEELECLTVHAMGTCRMGVDPRRSVVGPFGEAHDVRNLFVA